MAEFPEYQHRFQAVKACPTDGHGSNATIRVDACLHYLRGNTLPYFSVTAEIRVPRRNDCEACGCLHTEVRKYWPVLEPVIALHLSDSAGAPMHAEANGWYQLAGFYGGAGQRYHAGNGQSQHWKADGTFDGYRASTPEECLQSFAHRVRLPLEEVRAVAESWIAPAEVQVEYATVTQYLAWPEVKARYAAWIETQRPRWQAEADAACALLDSLIARQAERRAQVQA